MLHSTLSLGDLPACPGSSTVCAMPCMLLQALLSCLSAQALWLQGGGALSPSSALREMGPDGCSQEELAPSPEDPLLRCLGLVACRG